MSSTTNSTFRVSKSNHAERVQRLGTSLKKLTINDPRAPKENSTPALDSTPDSTPAAAQTSRRRRFRRPQRPNYIREVGDWLCGKCGRFINRAGRDRCQYVDATSGKQCDAMRDDPEISHKVTPALPGLRHRVKYGGNWFCTDCKVWNRLEYCQKCGRMEVEIEKIKTEEELEREVEQERKKRWKKEMALYKEAAEETEFVHE